MQREISFLVFLLFFTAALAASAEVTVVPAPSFEVVSGSDEHLRSDDVRGQVVILFYETRDTTEKNQELKDVINAYIFSLPMDKQAQVLRLPLINAADANWFTKGIWQEKFIESSQQNNLTVYGDWDGEMAGRFGFVADDCNFMIIDKRGMVRYRRSGVVEGVKTFSEIRATLGVLLNQQI